MSTLLVTITLLYNLHLASSNVLTKVGGLYLPDPVGTDGVDMVESIAIDTINSLIFSANGAQVTVDVTSFDASTPSNIPMTLIDTIDIQSVIPTADDIPSVTYSKTNRLVYATVSPVNVAQDFGYLVVIDAATQAIANTIQLTDCFLPDHVTETHDGKTIIIACEGEPDDNKAANPTYNPPGSIAMVDTNDWSVNNVNFEEFDRGGSKTLPGGIYLPHQNEAFSINVEPECSVVDNNDKYAYITLQENNAIGVLDINNKEIIAVFSLGFHDFSQTGLDASNKDDMINIQTYPNLFGLRMPDALDFVQTSDGKQYILTANEGDSKKFDEVRVKDITLNPRAFCGIDLDALQSDKQLGRLKIINQLGLDRKDRFKQLYAFSSRDFTIWEIITSDSGNDIIGIQLVYSSLDEFEQQTAIALGTDGFNSNYHNPSFDDRSDDKGPEAEAIVVGKCSNGNVYSFIGLERVGGIMVYDITNPSNAQFVEYLNDRDFSVEIEKDSRPPIDAGDTAPEQLRFIDESVYGVPLLFEACTESSSIGIYTVNCN